MKEARLTDLDELALKVRNRAALSYILEAIDAYRVGAYRSSIISTWIAVSFDIISKIRELAEQGDSNANTFINKLDKAVGTQNVKELQKIEAELLEKAGKEFEFLSAQELKDIEQLKADRHLCAHPAFIAEELLFEPEPERVRMHIVHVVKYLLQHQPVQGRSAIERIKKDIVSDLFPLSPDGASKFLNAKYFNRAKESLVRTTITLLVKATLRGDIPDLPLRYSRQMILTLRAISQSHPDVYTNQMNEKLPSVIESLDENHWTNVFTLLGGDTRCWNWIGENVQLRLKALVEFSLSQANIPSSVFEAMVIDDLESILKSKFDKLAEHNQINIIKSVPQPQFANTAINIYKSAGSYRYAEELGYSLIVPMSPYFSENHIQKILEIVQKNGQIWDAAKTPWILEELYQRTRQKLPSVIRDWESLFSFIYSQMSYFQRKEDKNCDVWHDSKWENLVKLAAADGIKTRF